MPHRVQSKPNGGVTSADLVRRATIDRELAQLRSWHDLAMSAFKFDEADALQRRIAALEDERQSLAAGQPAPLPAAVAPIGIVPLLAQPRRRRPR